MFERFSDGARRVLVLAHDEAVQLGHGTIGTAHLVLGALREPTGVAGHLLSGVGVTVEAARARLEAGPAVAERGAPSGFTDDAKAVLALALREAIRLRHHDIGTEHLLLAICDRPVCAGAVLLVDLGASPEELRSVLSHADRGYALVATGRRVAGGTVTGGTVTGRTVTARTADQAVAEQAIAAQAIANRADEPRCPQCRIPLAANLGLRTVEVRGGADDPADPVAPTVVVVFCRRCGTAVGTAT